ncbi:two-component response regulator-like PRR37 [Panicum miliaceum]|uniref:Two-component response regulator-like PRR37 n=1 Tax=Panicum miliaceum TaxID=4540 RepID=A0A3L6SGT8_PANMI|nr:two-component response regulator-like PRR37 [Panicum miliaceum]
MFRHSVAAASPSSAPSYSDALMHQQHAAASFPAALSVTVPAQIPRGAAAGYLDGNVGAFSSPPSSCYSSSLPASSYYNSIQRSISSHSLPMHIQLADVSFGGGSNGFLSPSSPSPHQLPLLPLSSSPSSSSGDLFEFTSSCPVRRVFSTGDLQGMNGSSPPRPVPSGDGCGQEGGGPFSQKVGRYSAEERKERIERYRVKRHQRNFNKKITYACRKTLADSRPRVKGRFARNGEADAEADEREASDISYEYCCGHNELSNGNNTHSGGGGCYDGNHYRMLDGLGSNGAVSAFSGAGDNGEWWWRAPGAAAAAAADDAQRLQRQVGFDDEDELWATLGDMLSVHQLAS